MTTRPLYFQAIPHDFRPAEDSHHGLWFDRFFDKYEGHPDWKVQETEKNAHGKKPISPKLDWLKTFERPCGTGEQIEQTLLRRSMLISALQGVVQNHQAEWHFATGLGNPHPVENGFLWHPTLGTPYIPGAAVKGLVRAWMEFSSDQEKWETLYRWFGSEHKLPAERAKLRGEGSTPTSRKRTADKIPDTEAGSYIFFDALPVDCVTLRADVMTPHMGDWYEKGGDAPPDPKTRAADWKRPVPADWHDPVPVFFLVAVRPKFQFAIAPRFPSAKKELPDVLQALTDALAWLGAGAKTAAGYGLMIKK